MNAPAAALIGSFRVYQAVIRPLAACHCRFYPRCSDYGIEAVQIHGAWRGARLATSRVLRCNPWVSGGYDPVPAPRVEVTG